MHSRSSSPCPFQSSLSPSQDETSLEPMCETPTAYNPRSVYDERVTVLRPFRPMPLRHRFEDETNSSQLRQRNPSISQLIKMFGNLTDQEGMESSSYSFGPNLEPHSPSPSPSRVAPFPVPDHMIDWTHDVILDASSLPIWGDTQTSRHLTFTEISEPFISQESVEENCRGSRRRKRTSEYPKLQFIPRHSAQSMLHTSGDQTSVEEPRKRRKRGNDA